MTYEVLLLPPARKDLLGLPRKVRDLVIQHLRALAADPRPPGSEPMAGDQRGRRKLRVGDYRVVYAIEDRVLVVEVIVVAHRSRVYAIAARRRG
jgi:mRNA interferase RelE/StbE